MIMALHTANTIKHKKRQMRGMLTIPFLILYIFTFTLLYTTMTLLDYTNSRRTITNAVDKTLDNFALNLSLQVSANNSVITNPDIINYLTGTNGLESTIRAQLSAKVAQSPAIRANTIIPLNPPINSLSSYQISTFPANEAFLNLFPIKTFLIRSETSLFFLRHDVIPSSYDLVNYPPERGLCSLVEKIYKDDNVVGLLISDYYSDRLYEDGLAFSFPHGLTSFFVQLQNSDNLLQATNLAQTFKPHPATGFKYKLGREISIIKNLSDEQTVLDDLTLIISINPQPMVVRNIIILVILLVIAGVLIVTSSAFINFTSNKIFEPLSEINDNIKRFLE